MDSQQERTKRELRLQIGRLRRRIDGRARAAGREARRLTSWRAYVQGYPGSAIMAALGVGLALSAGLSARRLSRHLGLRLVRRAAATIGHALWREVQDLWTESASADGSGQDTRTGHGQG